MQPSMLAVKSFSVSIFILRRIDENTEVLLLRRTGYLAGAWCQVAGCIEAGETAWQTALREAREETGLIISDLWSADVCEQFYEVEKECITLVPAFVGLVSADTRVVLNDEHDAYRWVSVEEARSLFSFAGQRRTLDQVWAEFVDREPSPLLKIRVD